MSPVVALTLSRYRPFWVDQLRDACRARHEAATSRPLSIAAYLLADQHVRAVAQIIASLPGES